MLVAKTLLKKNKYVNCRSEICIGRGVRKKGFFKIHNKRDRYKVKIKGKNES